MTSISSAITFDLSTLVLREWPALKNSCTYWFGFTGGCGRRSEKEIEAWIWIPLPSSLCVGRGYDSWWLCLQVPVTNLRAQHPPWSFLHACSYPSKDAKPSVTWLNPRSRDYLRMPTSHSTAGVWSLKAGLNLLFYLFCPLPFAFLCQARGCNSWSSGSCS